MKPVQEKINAVANGLGKGRSTVTKPYRVIGALRPEY